MLFENQARTLKHCGHLLKEQNATWPDAVDVVGDLAVAALGVVTGVVLHKLLEAVFRQHVVLLMECLVLLCSQARVFVLIVHR